MPRIKTVFENDQNESLSAMLELPDGDVKCFALFAHCFTCAKDGIAATYISRILAENGIAVLRFDFTGLGDSDGDFSNTNFSSNIQDLIAAAAFLQQQYRAPQLLVGHSLGGAAVLAVAQYLPSVSAVVTINAPATAEHVKQLFAGAYDEIESNQSARVSLGGRKFTLRKQFVDDLERYQALDHIERLNKALLIFHSPIDAIVSIDEAARIYAAAKHPKSFVSLDNADHLVSNKADADYIASVIAMWVSRYVEPSPENLPQRHNDSTNQQPAPAVAHGTVIVRERNKQFTREIFTEQHQFISDEPVKMGGADLGANPYELLLAALGSCTSMTLRMYANHKQLDLVDIEVELSHSRVHAKDCETCENQSNQIDKIERVITLTGQLSEAQRLRLMEIANQCPVHKTLQNKIVIATKLAE